MNMRQKQAIFYIKSSIKGKTFFFLFIVVSSFRVKPGKWAVMYLCVSDIDFASFYDFTVWFRNCFDSVVFFVFHFIGTLYFVLNGTNQNASNGNSNSSYWHTGLGNDLVMIGILYNVTIRWPIMKVSLLYSV